jgi:hypothetical protein
MDELIYGIFKKTRYQKASNILQSANPYFSKTKQYLKAHQLGRTINNHKISLPDGLIKCKNLLSSYAMLMRYLFVFVPVLRNID